MTVAFLNRSLFKSYCSSLEQVLLCQVPGVSFTSLLCQSSSFWVLSSPFRLYSSCFWIAGMSYLHFYSFPLLWPPIPNFMSFPLS